MFPLIELNILFLVFHPSLYSLENANKVLEFMIIPAIVTSIMFFTYNLPLSLMVLKDNAKCNSTKTITQFCDELK